MRKNVSANSQNNASDVEKHLEVELLIGWVNGFSMYPHCAQTFDLNDLRRGIAFCELVFEIIVNQRNNSDDSDQFLSRVVTSELTPTRSLQNIALAIREIADSSLRITAQEVYSDDNAALELLKYLKGKHQRTHSQSVRRVSPPHLKQHLSQSPSSGRSTNNRINEGSLSPQNYNEQDLSDANSKQEALSSISQPSQRSRQRQVDEVLIQADNQDIFNANVKRMSDSLGAYFRKQVSSSERDVSSQVKVQQKQESASQTKFYQMRKMHAEGERPFLEGTYEYTNQQTKGQLVEENIHEIYENDNVSGSELHQISSQAHTELGQEDLLQPNQQMFSDESQKHLLPNNFSSSHPPWKNKSEVHPKQKVLLSQTFGEPPRHQNSTYSSSQQSPTVSQNHSETSTFPYVANTMRTTQLSNEDKPRSSSRNSKKNTSSYQRQLRPPSAAATSPSKNINNPVRSQASRPSPKRQSISPHASHQSHSDYMNRREIDHTSPPPPPARQIDLKKILFDREPQSSRASPAAVIQFPQQLLEVSFARRVKLLDWMGEIRLVKRVINLEIRLHKICKDGLIFADLINLLTNTKFNGGAVRGLIRKPTNAACVTANFSKIFAYLRTNERMNPRFLANEKLIQTNEHAFWGFFDDLYYFFHNKLSPNDPRYMKFHHVQEDNHQGEEDGKEEDDDQLNNLHASTISTISRSAITPIHRQTSINSPQSARSLPSSYYVPKKQPMLLEDTTTADALKKRQARIRAASRGSSGGDFHLPDVIEQDEGGFEENSESKRDLRTEDDQASSSNNRQSTEELHQSAPLNYDQCEERDSSTTSLSPPPCFQAVRAWLSSLGFERMLRKHEKLSRLTATSEYDNQLIITDPVRNGVLLCLVISRIEMSRVDAVIRHPNNIPECIHNFSLAYSNIRSRTVCVPINLLWREKEICSLTGSLSSLWLLIEGLMQSMTAFNSERPATSLISSRAYCSPNNKDHRGVGNSPRSFASHQLLLSPTRSFVKAKLSSQPSSQHLSAIQLPHPPLTDDIKLSYSFSDLQQLKQSIVRFARSLGAFAGLATSPTEEFAGFLELCGEGAILCNIISAAFNLKIVGVARKTRTKATALSNIRKFMEIYRRTKSLPNIFFITEEAIYQKTPHLIIYLLEELIRTIYNVPHSHGLAQTPFVLKEEPQVQKNDVDLQLFDEDQERSPRQAISAHKLSLSQSRRLSKSMINSTSGRREEVSFADVSTNKELLKKYNESFQQQGESSLGKERSGEVTLIEMSRMQADIAAAPEETSESVSIKEWLNSLGFSELSLRLNFSGPTVEEFKDGTVLCGILGLLEGRRLAGINTPPKSLAQSIFNIRKCIELLETKHTFDQRVLWDEDLIYAASTATIKEILLEVKRFYRKTTKAMILRRHSSSGVIRSVVYS